MARSAICTAALGLLLMLLVHKTAAARDNSILQDHALSAEAAEAMVPALQDATLQDVAQVIESVGRRLLTTTSPTTNVMQLKLEAKNNLLASDAFGLVYTGGNFARAIFALLLPMVVAGQTGAIAVDANYLLNLSQLMAQFIATLGDLLSKGARLTADGIAPV